MRCLRACPRRPSSSWKARTCGNTDVIRAVEFARRLAGPFTVASPWGLEDADGTRRINASGCEATPFGDRYPPLADFLRRHLDESGAAGLPQQLASARWAALEAKLVQLVARPATKAVGSLPHRFFQASHDGGPDRV